MPLLLPAPMPHPPGPDLIALVTDTLHSAHTKRAYRDAIASFLSWCHISGQTGVGKITVHRYRCALEDRGLSPATVKVHLAAVRRLATEMADNGLLDPAIASSIAGVKGPSRRGVRTGNWLTLQQTEALLRLPDGATLKGK